MREISTKRDLREALSGFRRIVVAVSTMSGVINILALTGSFYMLQIYDRVLSSHSVPTLVAISILATGLYLALGVLDVLRGQVLVRLGARLQYRLSPLAHRAAIRAPLFGASTTDAMQSVRDVDSIRSFLGSQGPVAFFDMPWMPIYLIFVFLLHPWLGYLALFGVLILTLITYMTERMTASLNKTLVQMGTARNNILDANARNAEVIQAMGIGGRAGARFQRADCNYLDTHARASDLSGGMSGGSKVLRMILQSAILGLGAYLVLHGEMSPGAIIAGSIASSRALAPVELAIGHWKQFSSARQAYARLKATFERMPDAGNPLKLPPPTKTVAVENITVLIPGTNRVALSNVNFELTAGQGLGVIGPSAAGKSTLARAITTVWPLARGSIRLDGAASDRWSEDDLGNHIGYLPQDVELFDGTIGDNISRFAEKPESGAILAAAMAADVHEMILRLPDGYETRLGPGGTSLSAGQRQRIALARALYGNPFLVVLDEPNSNLDADGELALTQAIAGVRQRGGVAIVIAHRRNALEAVDMLAIINGGQLTAFGPRDEVLRKVTRKPLATAS